MEIAGCELTPPESLIYGFISTQGKMSLGHLIHLLRNHLPCREVRDAIERLIERGLVALTDEIDYTDGDRALAVCLHMVTPTRH